MSNPKMVSTNMQVLRHYDGDGNLQRVLKPSAPQEAFFLDGAIPAGRCVSQNSAGEFELGCSGRRVPYWLWRKTDAPSGGWSGESVMSATGLTWADGSVRQFLCFAGIEGLEIATTEYLATDTFVLNDLLRAPTTTVIGGTDADKRNFAGKVTKTTVVYGKDPVVGVVTSIPGEYARFGLTYVAFYTLYRPPLEGLADDLDEPVWDV